ncbi:acyl-CoA dehydrogenase family protein [Rhizorhabdus dicambivorans]|uniref:acyl-CoA dehydrogenase family protein n=1 Tax=Rhizorhabdus dicambivorans TaxID=1850238 RepID=UPI00083673C9|nr:acyl-CoA dehydrogenase family protein [Rhizorhabdus dicambivorans]
MDFRLNEEQQMLRDMVERFVQERFDPAVRPHHRIPAAGFDGGNWVLLAELGLLALPLAEEDGGLAGGPVELMVVAEALGRGVVAEPYLTEILFAGQLLARAGTPAQKERFLANVAAGAVHIAVAHAEPASRFALDDVETRFTDGRIDGTKTFIVAGAATDAFIVTARGEDGTIGLYLVEAGAAGITRQDYRLIDGATAAQIGFAGTPAEPMAGDISILAALIDELRVPIAAEMLGLMSALFDTTLDYIRVRKQFGASIGSFQAIQHRMADQYMAVEQSRSLLYRAALAEGEGAEAARIGAKAYIAEAGVRLAEEAIQLHGGMGITDELIVGHAYKRMLLLASLFGDPDTEIKRYAAAMR